MLLKPYLWYNKRTIKKRLWGCVMPELTQDNPSTDQHLRRIVLINNATPELLRPEDMQTASAEQKKRWVDKSHEIISSRTPEQLAQLSFDDRLSLAAASHLFVARKLDLGENPT